jgi:transcription termination factor Rho
MLNRKLQERRIFPAFDIEQSSTRREELLLGPDVLQRAYTMRNMLSHLQEDPEMGVVGAYERFINQFRLTESNEEFMNSLPGAGSNGNNHRSMF